MRARREERETLIAERKRILKVQDPRLQELEDDTFSLALRTFEAASNGSLASKEDIVTALTRETERIQSTRTAILSDAGKESDYLSPPYVCPKCRDTGFVGDKMCTCFETLLAEELFSRSNLTPKMRAQTFAAMREDLYSDTIHPKLGCSLKEYMQNIRQIALDFVQTFEESPKNLLFYGASGLGKTYYSSAIANELLKKKASVLYVSAADLFSTLQKKCYSKDAEDVAEYEKMQEMLLSVDLLILDDLGTEMVNNFSVPEFFRILNTRLLDGKSMIINTNLDLTDLKEIYSERIASRLVGEFTLCHFVGDDLRFASKQ